MTAKKEKLIEKAVSVNPKDEVVSKALGEIKQIIHDVKTDSFSNFEYLKAEISKMLMQPENI